MWVQLKGNFSFMIAEVSWSAAGLFVIILTYILILHLHVQTTACTNIFCMLAKKDTTFQEKKYMI